MEIPWRRHDKPSSVLVWRIARTKEPGTPLVHGSQSQTQLKRLSTRSLYILSLEFKILVSFFSCFVLLSSCMDFIAPILPMFLVESKCIGNSDCYVIVIKEMIRKIFMLWSFLPSDYMMKLIPNVFPVCVYVHILPI